MKLFITFSISSLVHVHVANITMFSNTFGIGVFVATFILIASGRKYPDNLADFPFAVSVTIKLMGHEVRYCTGAIVSENIVLTSQFCMSVEGPEDVTGYVRAGADIIDSDGDIHEIETFYIHEGYDKNDLRHNMCLLEVHNFFDFTTYINEVPLNWDFLVGVAEVRVVGFMGNGAEPHKKLNAFNTRTVDVNVCRETYKRRGKEDMVREETVCVEQSTNAKLCDMSPGSLLLRKNKLIGIFTYALDNCVLVDPILFSLIARYGVWMNKITDPQIFDRD